MLRLFMLRNCSVCFNRKSRRDPQYSRLSDNSSSQDTDPSLMTEDNQDSDCDGFEEWANIPDYSETHLLPPSAENLFRPGMGIELNELNYPSMLCVGGIKEVSGDYVFAHFDGWSSAWDVWYRWNSPEIRPVGTCESLQCYLFPPYQGPDSETWEKTGNWNSYLAAKDSIAAPVDAFSKLCITEFKGTTMIQPLMVLSANKVASIAHCYIGMEEFIGHHLHEKLQRVQVCSMCDTNYLLGYKCVKAFTIHKKLKSRAERKDISSSVCSLPCCTQFQQKFIGCVPNQKCSTSNPSGNVLLPFDHLIANSVRDKTVSTPEEADKPSPSNLFRVGMKLECIDVNYPTMYCPGTILRVDGDEVLVNFDGWGHVWDIWLYWHSTQLRPTGTTQALGNTITTYFEHRMPFTWDKYLEDTSSVAAPINAFSKLHLCEFSDNIYAVLPLRYLVIHKLLDLHSRLKYTSCTQIFPFQINGKPFQVKNCYICKRRYFQGWLAIPSFSVPISIKDPSSTAKLCSRKCLKKYHEENI